MKTITTLFYLFLFSGVLLAQKFDLDTIHRSGPTNNRVNIALLADGYTSSQQAKFISDATIIANAFLNTTPYKEYKNYINIVAVKVISNQSGAGHPRNSSDNACGSLVQSTVDNYFGSSFDCGGNSYHRLLCATKSNKVPAVMAASFPEYDQALIIVNSSEYGGAGGTFAVTSVHSSAREIAIHEVGHSLAFLADEYWAGSQYASNARPNMTNTSNYNNDVNNIKWKLWLGNVGGMTVGSYPHAGNAAWRKPVNGQCKMENLGVQYPFCPVCTEAHILKFLDLTQPYDSYTPANGTTIDAVNDLTFSLVPVLPEPNTLEIEWRVNSTIAHTGTNASHTVLLALLNEGNNTVQARLLDKSSMIRNETHATAHAYTINWTVNKSLITGIEIVSQMDKLNYALFPNPANSHEVRLEYHLNSPASVGVVLYDLQGKVFPLQSCVWQEEGKHILEVGQLAPDLSSGMYVLSVIKNGVEIATEKLVVE